MPCVRPAQPTDLPRIMEIASSTPAAAQWSASEYAKLFSSKTLASKSVQDRAVLVAEDERIVQGFIVGRGVGTDWEIENIAVISSAQRHGLGQLLLARFLQVVLERGGTNVFLEVRESNRPARLLYEKAGFVEVGQRKGYYQAPPEDAVVLKISFS